MTIDVWADVLCPWCYIGEKRIESAIEQSGHAGDIDLRLHTFVLDPSASEQVGSVVEYIAKRLGRPVAEARALEQNMAGLAAAEGLAYEVDHPHRSTADVLRLVHLANEHGVGWEFMRAVQAEVFGGNFAAYEHDTLTRVGEKVGLPADEIREVLNSDRYAEDVRADHDAAVRLGAQGVPFTVLGNRLGVRGAASVSQFAQAIDQAWGQTHG